MSMTPEEIVTKIDDTLSKIAEVDEQKKMLSAQIKEMIGSTKINDKSLTETLVTLIKQTLRVKTSGDLETIKEIYNVYLDKLIETRKAAEEVVVITEPTETPEVSIDL